MSAGIAHVTVVCGGKNGLGGERAWRRRWAEAEAFGRNHVLSEASGGLAKCSAVALLLVWQAVALAGQAHREIRGEIFVKAALACGNRRGAAAKHCACHAKGAR